MRLEMNAVSLNARGGTRTLKGRSPTDFEYSVLLPPDRVTRVLQGFPADYNDNKVRESTGGL